MGGAFVKLGQLLSTRPDILPRVWIEELSRLQDDVKAVEFRTLLVTLESDLGPWAEKFQSIDSTPLAAGSIAQVHPAVTIDGQEVVVKIRKPGIRKTMLQDCDILQALAEQLEKHVTESRNYRPVQIVEEFRNAVIQELDFTQEGRNLDRFRADFPEDPVVVFPMPFWDQTTERILTMERIHGIKISLIDELRSQGADTVALARHLGNAVLKQILEHGFFHGDPHPGNLLVVNGSNLCFLDCGMVGRLDERTRENLVLLVAAGLQKDVDGIADIMIDMHALPPTLDRNRFLKEANLLLDRYYRLPLKRIRLTSLVNEIMDLINQHQILIPQDLVLVGKALITLEGVGRSLDPDFDAVAVADPFIREMALTTSRSQVTLQERSCRGRATPCVYSRSFPRTCSNYRGVFGKTDSALRWRTRDWWKLFSSWTALQSGCPQALSWLPSFSALQSCFSPEKDPSTWTSPSFR